MSVQNVKESQTRESESESEREVEGRKEGRKEGRREKTYLTIFEFSHMGHLEKHSSYGRQKRDLSGRASPISSFSSFEGDVRTFFLEPIQAKKKEGNESERGQ